jgi:DNA-directed RNA polymerase subunit RPC12/RpoP
MTRLCTLCKQVMGEKCARCGTEATPLKTNSNGQAMIGTDFDCPSCGHRFAQGDGGETGGMCESCFDAALRKAHEQKTKSPRA